MPKDELAINLTIRMPLAEVLEGLIEDLKNEIRRAIDGEVEVESYEIE